MLTNCQNVSVKVQLATQGLQRTLTQNGRNVRIQDKRRQGACAPRNANLSICRMPHFAHSAIAKFETGHGGIWHHFRVSHFPQKRLMFIRPLKANQIRRGSRAQYRHTIRR